MKLTREEALEMAKRCKRLLEEKFGVKAYIFGSIRGDAPFHDASDVDIAVEGLPSHKYFEALRALDEVVPKGVEVDLICLESASPELVAYVKGGKKISKEPREALRQQVGDELRALDRVVEGMRRFLEEARGFPHYARVRTGGSFLHDFYCSIERILERVCVWLEGKVPSGEDWHRQLLWHMAEEVKEFRPALLSRKLAKRVEKYLKFRHRFRHTYGEELEWGKMRPLLEGAPEVLGELKAALERFFSKLGGEERG